jgi:hypothetical protein
MLEYMYGFWYYDYDKELKTIAKQRKLRYEMHKQVNLSNIKLKKVNTIEKIGIWELEKLNKHSKIPIPSDDGNNNDNNKHNKLKRFNNKKFNQKK